MLFALVANYEINPAASAGAGDGAGTGESAEGTGGSGDGEKKHKKKKKVRRRVEPLPEFAALAQAELAKLQTAFDNANSSYKGESCLSVAIVQRSQANDGAALVKFFKEDPELPADELFTNIHTFVQARDLSDMLYITTPAVQVFESTLKAMIDKKKKEKDAKRREKEKERIMRRAARRKEAIENGEPNDSLLTSLS
jgi:hypothetical protein